MSTQLFPWFVFVCLFPSQTGSAGMTVSGYYSYRRLLWRRTLRIEWCVDGDWSWFLILQSSNSFLVLSCVFFFHNLSVSLLCLVVTLEVSKILLPDENYSLYLTLFKTLCSLLGISGSYPNVVSLIWSPFLPIADRLRSTGILKVTPVGILSMLQLESLALYLLTQLVVPSELRMGPCLPAGWERTLTVWQTLIDDERWSIYRRLVRSSTCTSVLWESGARCPGYCVSSSEALSTRTSG